MSQQERDILERIDILIGVEKGDAIMMDCVSNIKWHVCEKLISASSNDLSQDKVRVGQVQDETMPYVVDVSCSAETPHSEEVKSRQQAQP